ncbi:MAG: LPS assembly protein LptD [Alphaproteobacteria bacterium]|nr:LPS assembly protein LptD [Alphaproteobacteria bacterium]
MFVWGLLIAIVLGPSNLCAQQHPPAPLQLKADQITYQETQSTVTATGHVVVTQKVFPNGSRTLYADAITYNKDADTLSASGNVYLEEPSGDILTADSVSFSDDFKKGMMKAMEMITKDREYLSAETGSRENGSLSTAEESVYTPCSFCRTNKKTSPFWQIRAEKVTHDQNNQTVTYNNARLEIKGVPVFYTPYFYHPDPTVKRKSGILTPIYGSTRDLGGIISLPVYYSIAGNRDLTMTPILTSKQGPIIVSEYRHRFRDGESKLAGSYTRTHGLPLSQPIPFNGPRAPKPDRWHVAGMVNYHQSDERRLFLDVNRASDTTYLSRYPITRQTPSFMQNKNLTSTAMVEQFSWNSYLGIRAFAFQTDTPKTTPMVLPKAVYATQVEPKKIGGILRVDANVLSLSRENPIQRQTGSEMQRVSLGVDWKSPHITSSGQLVTPRLTMRGDGYFVRNYRDKKENVVGRLLPQASIDWRYPLVRRFDQNQWVMQPMGMVVASPYSANRKNIPNEDSTSFELDDTSLFRPNRYGGIDRVDTGYRGVYGLDNTVHFPDQKLINVFVGQTKRLDHHQAIPTGLGEDNAQSDYIARLKIKPISWLTARYRTAIKPANGHPRYSEMGVSLGDKKLRLDTGYVYLNKEATQKHQSVSQLNWQARGEMTDNWSLSFAQIRNLKHNRGGASLASFASASYKNDCFRVDFGIYKTGYSDRDIRPDSGFLVQLTFKNLGSFTPSTTTQYPGSMLTHF